MRWKIFKPTIGRVILTLVIFIILIIFLFPAKMNVLCEIGNQCPSINDFVMISEIFTNPRFVSPNYLYLVIEFVISYLFSYIFVFGYKNLRRK